MPAVSVCDPVAAALRHSLDLGQSKNSSESGNISLTLAGGASRILQTEIRYEEADGYRSTVLDQLKAKYLVLSLPPNVDNQSENGKSGLSSGLKKKNNSKTMGPSLPEPAITLYSADKVHLGWKGTFPVGAGMYNVGNTCYLNSTLQALFHVPALVNWLLSDSHHNSKCEQNDTGGECLTCAVAKTLQFSHEKSGSAIKPFYIYNKLKLICRTMVPGQQEDAHEFLRYLLEGMERAYLARHRASKLDSYSKETTPINQIFGGYIRTEVKCLQCRHVSTTFQHFQDLLVDIRKASTLDEALTSYFSREQLDNNDYKCEACKRRVPATKQFTLERPPKVLCVQLKRFSVLGGKISRHIGFKQTIDMGPYLWREPEDPVRQLNYKLMSMVTHMGPSVNCGHYTAVAQVSTGQYYSFDDSCVRSINLGNVSNTNAYIMIFEMEPQIPNPPISGQPPKINGAVPTKTISNGIVVKNVSKVSSSNELSNGGTKKIHENSSTGNISGCGVIKLPTTTSNAPTKIGNFIGPQLPPRLAEKTGPRLVVHVKNERATGGSSLVPYEGSSDEDDGSSSSVKVVSGGANVGTTKNGTNGATNGSTKILSKDAIGTGKSVVSSKDCVQKSVKNGGAPVSGTAKTVNGGTGNVGANAVGNGSIVGSTVKHQNGKTEVNCRNGDQNGKDKWHGNRGKTNVSGEEKVVTKAAASSSNGWQVSKDDPSPTSGATPNGWSVTDNKDGKSLSHNSNAATPSAAAPRNFNGTNRSETVSHLLKMSNRGYGTSSVSNWNGGRAHLEREVDNERREERKRHHDPDDEEMDRGRTKKTKTHRDYDNGRSNPGYNPFQEHQNGKNWNKGSNGAAYYGKRHNYNTSNGRGNRSRHGGGNHRPHYGQNYNRYHNYSRDHWQRR